MPRALIFLFDGTGNDPTDASESEPTNVFNINSLIAESRLLNRRHRSQVTFYVPGIGTTFYSRGSGIFGRIRQLLFGDGLDEMVMRSYINLAANYRSGDHIVTIGFSRGAVAARLFCRIISDFGLLRAKYVRLFSDMFEAFSDAHGCDFNTYSGLATAYKEGHSSQLTEEIPSIDFLGLFDCVFGELDRKYTNFLEVIDESQSLNIRRYLHLMSLHDVRQHFCLSRLRPISGSGREIWMPGVHSDVGGGYAHDLIARVSLLTMAQALHTEAGIALEGNALSELNTSIDALISADRLTVNDEGSSPIRKYRKEYVIQNDKIHAIQHLFRGRMISWKGEGDTVYEDRFPDTLIVDKSTQHLIRKHLKRG
jgi:uncharacterized protein (DUF2235 family)